MSAFNGTPGPWEAVNGSDVFTRLGALNAAGVEAARNDGWHIADCDMGETETDEGPDTLSSAEKRANARLIAAAPDLLEALRDLMPEFESRIGDFENAEWHDCWNKAVAAIAKAIGEQP